MTRCWCASNKTWGWAETRVKPPLTLRLTGAVDTHHLPSNSSRFFLMIMFLLSVKLRQPRGPVKKRPPIRASTADEAIEKMLEQKKISSKINYDVLKDLNIKPGSSPARKPESPKTESCPTKLAGRNRKPARAPLSLSTPLSTLGKRLVDSLRQSLVRIHVVVPSRINHLTNPGFSKLKQHLSSLKTKYNMYIKD